MINKWEYKRISTTYNINSTDKINTDLMNYGEDGWEIIFYKEEIEWTQNSFKTPFIAIIILMKKMINIDLNKNKELIFD